MPNTIALLILIIAGALSFGGGSQANPLLNIGFLLTLAYLTGVIVKRIGLPRVFGFVLAGMIAGHNGLGFIHEEFLHTFRLVEKICLMIFMVRAICISLSVLTPMSSLKNTLAGGITSIIVIPVAALSVYALGVSPIAALATGLIAATFSPLSQFGWQTGTETQKGIARTTLFGFGGYFVAVTAWGIAVAFVKPDAIGRIRLAFMPFVIGITSILAGFAWAYVIKRFIVRGTSGINLLLPLGVIVMAIPWIEVFGLDFLFVATGIGTYYGLMTERHETTVIKTIIVPLVIFGFLGIKLSIRHAILFAPFNWMVVLAATAAAIVVRLVFVYAVMLRMTGERIPREFAPGILLYGPLTLYAIDVFLAGFGDTTGERLSRFDLYYIGTMIVILTVFVAAICKPFIARYAKLSENA